MTIAYDSPTTPRRPRVVAWLSAERASWLLVWLMVIARVLLSAYRISRPGLQSDETLFVNAATLRIPGEFIDAQIHGIPIMVSPYIGALKSWIYAPIFSLFGSSALTIRLPVVLITSAGLPLLYVAVRDLVNRPVALLAVAVLSFDQSVFWLTRDDVGPNAIGFLLKCVALFCCARLASDRRLRWLALLLAALALGVFNKLNFIWTVDAATAASVVVALAHRRALRRHVRLAASWAGGLSVIYLAFAARYFGDDIASIGAPAGHVNLLAHTWPLFDHGTQEVLSGTWFLDYALTPTNPRVVVVAAIVGLFVAGAIASVLPARTRSLPVACLALATVLTAVQTLLTYQATAGWHYIEIYPWVMIVAAYGGWVLLRAVTHRAAWVAGAMAVLGLATLAYDGVLMNTYLQALDREPSFSPWSTAIYSLSRYLSHSSATVFVTDWGIYDSLLALDQTYRYRDNEFSFVSSAPAALQAADAVISATPGPKLIVTHVNDKLVFPTVNANLRKAEAGHLRLVRIVDGVDGTPVYLVYGYRSARR